MSTTSPLARPYLVCQFTERFHQGPVRRISHICQFHWPHYIIPNVNMDELYASSSVLNVLSRAKLHCKQWNVGLRIRLFQTLTCTWWWWECVYFMLLSLSYRVWVINHCYSIHVPGWQLKWLDLITAHGSVSNEPGSVTWQATKYLRTVSWRNHTEK